MLLSSCIPTFVVLVELLATAPWATPVNGSNGSIRRGIVPKLVDEKSAGADRTCQDIWSTSASLSSTPMPSSQCEDIVDANSNPCVWCDFTSSGMCFGEAQANFFSQLLDVDCRGIDSERSVETGKRNSIEKEFGCAKASSDIDNCGEAIDSKGDACVWCWIADDFERAVGVCVNDGQASRLGEWGIECNRKQESPTVRYDPLDFTCAKEANDEESCNASKDQDGIDCVWCEYCGLFGLGICLNIGQVAYTKKLLQCDT